MAALRFALFVLGFFLYLLSVVVDKIEGSISKEDSVSKKVLSKVGLVLIIIAGLFLAAGMILTIISPFIH